MGFFYKEQQQICENCMKGCKYCENKDKCLYCDREGYVLEG